MSAPSLRGVSRLTVFFFSFNFVHLLPETQQRTKTKQSDQMGIFLFGTHYNGSINFEYCNDKNECGKNIKKPKRTQPAKEIVVHPSIDYSTRHMFTHRQWLNAVLVKIV